jgi:hypothetical protein
MADDVAEGDYRSRPGTSASEAVRAAEAAALEEERRRLEEEQRRQREEEMLRQVCVCVCVCLCVVCAEWRCKYQVGTAWLYASFRRSPPPFPFLLDNNPNPQLPLSPPQKYKPQQVQEMREELARVYERDLVTFFDLYTALSQPV